MASATFRVPHCFCFPVPFFPVCLFCEEGGFPKIQHQRQHFTKPKLEKNKKIQKYKILSLQSTPRDPTFQAEPTRLRLCFSARLFDALRKISDELNAESRFHKKTYENTHLYNIKWAQKKQFLSMASRTPLVGVKYPHGYPFTRQFIGVISPLITRTIVGGPLCRHPKRNIIYFGV